MAITSISIGGLDIYDETDYAAGAEMAYALQSMPTYDGVAVEMADRHAFFVRKQIQPKSIPLVVYLLSPTLAAREAAWLALLAACENPEDLVPLVWNDGSSRTLDVHVEELSGSAYYSRVTGTAVAYNPIPR